MATTLTKARWMPVKARTAAALATAGLFAGVMLGVTATVVLLGASAERPAIVVSGFTVGDTRSEAAAIRAAAPTVASGFTVGDTRSEAAAIRSSGRPAIVASGVTIDDTRSEAAGIRSSGPAVASGFTIDDTRSEAAGIRSASNP